MVTLSFFIPFHPILSYPIAFHSVPSYPDLFIRKKRQHRILISIPYMVTCYWPFWGCASDQVVGLSSALWSLLGRYGFIHWLLRGCARNWVKISLPKQSHSAIRRRTNPVSCASSNWLLCGQEWYFTYIYVKSNGNHEKNGSLLDQSPFLKKSQRAHP